MFNLFPNALINQLVPEATPGTGSPLLSGESTEAGAFSGAFAELLDAQSSLAEMLEELRDLLPAEEFSRLETMVEDGNLLPVAEIVAALRQQVSELPVSEAAPGESKPSWTQGNPIPLIAAPAANTAVAPGAVAMPTAPTAADVSGQAAAAFELEGRMEDPRQRFADKGLQTVETAVAQTMPKEPAGALFRAGAAMPEAGLVAAGGPAVAPNPQNPAQIGGMTAAQASPPPLEVPPGEKGWDQSMGERILWMVGRQVQGAELKITPPQLGPIDIRVSIQHDQASVSFAAQHAVVREALEAAVPRLREMLGENNLQLVNVDINQRDGGGQQAASDLPHRSSSGGGGNAGPYGADEEPPVAEAVRFYRSDGLVDDFA